MKKVLVRLTAVLLVSVLAIFALTNLRYCLSQKQRIETLNLDSEEFAGELIIGVRYKNSPKATLVSLESSSEIANGTPGFVYQSSNLAIYAETRIFEVDEVTLTIFYGINPTNYIEREGGKINGEQIYEHVEFSLLIEHSPDVDPSLPTPWRSQTIILSDDYIEHPEDHMYDPTGYKGDWPDYRVESFDRFNRSVRITLPANYFYGRIGDIKLSLQYHRFSGEESLYTEANRVIGDKRSISYLRQGDRVVLFDENSEHPNRKYE